MPVRMGISFTEGRLCPSFRQQGRAEGCPAFVAVELPSAKDSPYANAACLGGVFCCLVSLLLGEVRRPEETVSHCGHLRLLVSSQVQGMSRP